MNLLGTWLFRGHGGHSHSLSHSHSHSHSDDHSHSHGHSHGGSGGDVNMRAVFVHFVVDCISSVCVLVTGLLLMHGTGTWTLYVDPICSLVIVVILFITTIPILRECAQYVLMVAPDHVNTEQLLKRIQSHHGVISAHDMHVWNLNPSQTMASCHVVLAASDQHAARRTERQVRQMFLSAGIQSVVLQTEHIDHEHGQGHEHSRCDAAGGTIAPDIEVEPHN
jgi:solute carrier family 30 (zinc transporter), member 1